MSNDLTNIDSFGQIADVFKDDPGDPTAWTAGIGMSWPVFTIRGKEFGWRYQGKEHTYTAPDPSAGGSHQPVRTIEVVLVQPALRISKVYYADGYDPKKARVPPTCWSADGKDPDGAVSDEVKRTLTSFKCGGCRRNVVGSKIGDAGQRLKECTDNKRLALVTMGDLKNTDFGVPFMLRLPPGSFQNYTAYCGVMAERGFQPHQLVTRLSFESGVAHPKVRFEPVGALTNEQGAIVVAHRKNPRVGEMLNDKAVSAFLDPEVSDLEFEAEVTLQPAGSVTPPAANDWSPTPPKAPDTSTLRTKHEQPASQTPAEAQKARLDRERIAALEVQLAAAQKEAEPEPEPEPKPLTPEQLRIKELEAQVAEIQAQKKTRGRPRTKPVGPPEAGQVTATGNGANEPKPADTLANDLARRLDKYIPKTTE